MATTFSIAAVAGPLMSFSDLFNDPKELGAAVLIFVVAMFIAIAVSRMVPRDKGPTLFGTLAALAFVGGLAYLGVEAAGYVLWLVLAGAVLLGLFALFVG
ncbi:MAG: hypothetical protein ACT4N2_06200 [Hyphomicrobium sp.]